jgi:hypothetical protein
MNDDEKDKLVSQIISTDAGRKWLKKSKMPEHRIS